MTIRTKLWLTNTLAFVCIILATMLAVSVAVERIIRERTIVELTNSSQDICNMIQAILKTSIESSLRAHAEDALEIVRTYHQRAVRGEFSEEDARRRSERALLQLTFGKTGYFYGLTPEGVIFCHPQKDLIGKNVRSFPFIQIQVSRQQGYLEYMWRNPNEDKEHPKALYMLPFEPWQWIISATSYRRDFIHLIRKDFFRDAMLQIKHGKSGYATIIDLQGSWIIHPFLEGTNQGNAALNDSNRAIIQRVLKEKNGQILYPWTNPGEAAPREKIAIFKFLPEFDWIVVSTFYLDEIMESSKTLQRMILLITIISLFAIFLLNFGLGTLVTTPIRSLVESVRTITTGNLDHQAEVTRADEIGQLAQSFNVMTRKLKATMSTLSGIVESMPSALITLAENGTVVQWNPAATAVTGIKNGDATGKIFWEIVPSLGRFKGIFDQTLVSGAPTTVFHEKVTGSQGHGFQHLNIALFPIVLDDHKGGVLRIDDVTDLVVKDQALQQAQKMETIGMLAGGMAHDFNNALGGIVGAASLLEFLSQRGSLEGDKLRDNIRLLNGSARKATGLVQQLLSLARKSEMTLIPIDLNRIVKSVVEIGRSTFDKCVTIQSPPTKTPALVLGDPNQLEQVLLNLAINGLHAMTIMRQPGEPQGGTLTISVEPITAESTFCRLHPEAHEGDYWVLSVNDQGVGMDAQTLSRIFDPFFTTKAQGTGTGLGLLMTYSIIRQHQGFLKVYSEPGVGSTFNLFIPAGKGEAGNSETPAPILIPRGNGLILVIDDEPTVRQAASALLSACGYQTVPAEDGPDGIKIFRERHAEFAGVLLDVVMPRLSGREVFERLKEIDPKVRVLLASGYTRDERIDSLLALGIREFIQKPYSLEKLALAMHRVCNG